MGSRELEISDLDVGYDEDELIRDPYQFLELPEGAPFKDVRKSYINLARRYHPDMINPESSMLEAFKRYTKQEVERAATKYTREQILEMLKRLESEEDARELKAKIQKEIHADIQAIAHKKMVLINRAYAEIKSRRSGKEKKSFQGYDSVEIQSGRANRIDLEGHGQLIIYNYDNDYFVAGPYLEFDWGRDTNRPWELEYEFRHSIPIKHLFAHLEILEGKKVSKILLDSLVDCFSLSEEQIDTLTDSLKPGARPWGIVKALGIPSPTYEEDEDGWIYRLRLKHQLEHILTFSNETPEYFSEVSIEIKDGELIMTDYTTTKFSETDLNLFLTLAYGPLLSCNQSS